MILCCWFLPNFAGIAYFFNDYNEPNLEWISNSAKNMITRFLRDSHKPLTILRNTVFKEYRLYFQKYTFYHYRIGQENANISVKNIPSLPVDNSKSVSKCQKVLALDFTNIREKLMILRVKIKWIYLVINTLNYKIK